MGDIELLLLQKPRLRKLSVLHFSFELDNDGIITFQLHTFVEKIKNIKNTGKMEKTHKLHRFAPDFWDGWNFPNLFGDSLWCSAQVWKMKIVGIGWKVRMWKGILNLILPQIEHHRPHWWLLIKWQFLHSSPCVCPLPIGGSWYLSITLIAQNKQTCKGESQLDNSTKLFR